LLNFIVVNGPQVSFDLLCLSVFIYFCEVVYIWSHCLKSGSLFVWLTSV